MYKKFKKLLSYDAEALELLLEQLCLKANISVIIVFSAIFLLGATLTIGAVYLFRLHQSCSLGLF